MTQSQLGGAHPGSACNLSPLDSQAKAVDDLRVLLLFLGANPII